MHEFFTEKVKPTPTRKAPFLPRIGLTVDFAGRRFCYRYVPFFETLANLLETGPSFSALQRLLKEQFGEVRLSDKPGDKTVDVKARTISRKDKPAKAGLLSRRSSTAR